MKLSELFSYLTYGELATLKVGGKSIGGIHPTYSDEVLSYIVQGLSALYTRFNLRQAEVIIQDIEGITDYVLSPEYAVSNSSSTEAKRWIIDTEEDPFEGGVIRIEEVFNELGQRVPLNNIYKVGSFCTPRYDILQNPFSDLGNAYSVVYVSDHPVIDLTSKQPSEINIHLPSPLIRGLVLYVSSLANTAVGSQEAMQIGFAKMQEYEAFCLGMELQGTLQHDFFSPNKFRGLGWV
jgi:hypothetical protein